jgi:hypothetical protein
VVVDSGGSRDVGGGREGDGLNFPIFSLATPGTLLVGTIMVLV